MIEKPLVKNLKILVKAYGRATGQSQVAISKKLYKGAHFLNRLFAGEQSVSLHKLDEMLTTLVDEWPEGEPFPICEVIVIRGPKVKKTTLSPRNQEAV